MTCRATAVNSHCHANDQMRFRKRSVRNTAGAPGRRFFVSRLGLLHVGFSLVALTLGLEPVDYLLDSCKSTPAPFDSEHTKAQAPPLLGNAQGIRAFETREPCEISTGDQRSVGLDQLCLRGHLDNPGQFGCAKILPCRFALHGKMSFSFFPRGATSLGTAMDLKPAKALYRELSSAAVDAELARVARSWNVDEIESYVLQRKAGLSHGAALAERRGRAGPRRGKKTFHAIRDGGALKPGHAERLQALLPKSNLALWFAHPLADVLCHPALSVESLMDYLRRLPLGAVRASVWRDAAIQTKGMPLLSLAPWDAQLRASLERIGTPTSLFALLARLRLEQLVGNSDGGLDATRIIWRVLPRAISKCTHLLVSKDALIAALDHFLGWQPFADARLYEMVSIEPAIGRRAAVEACDRVWLADSRIPQEVKFLRKSHVTAAILPDSTDGLGWWGTFFRPDAFEYPSASHCPEN